MLISCSYYQHLHKWYKHVKHFLKVMVHILYFFVCANKKKYMIFLVHPNFHLQLVFSVVPSQGPWL
jgi:hypothetical protein